MDVKEIRVNSLVYWKDAKKEVFVKEPGFDYLISNPEYFEPIPLTKIWFERFGFDNDVWRNKVLPNSVPGATNTLTINSGVVFLNQESAQGLSNKQLLEAMTDVDTKMDVDKVAFPLKKNQVLLTARLRYVHQLQNLYFDLTGEELE